MKKINLPHMRGHEKKAVHGKSITKDTPVRLINDQSVDGDPRIRIFEKAERKEAGKGRERSSDRSDVGMRRVCGAGKAPR